MSWLSHPSLYAHHCTTFMKLYIYFLCMFWSLYELCWNTPYNTTNCLILIIVWRHLQRFYIIWFSNIAILSVPCECYCRNASCAVNLISTFLLTGYGNHGNSNGGGCVYVLCFLRLVYRMLPVSLDFPFFITPSVFSNVYLVFQSHNNTTIILVSDSQ
jgi:hypothetical protein